jgi:hypothetical protein
MPKIAIPMLDPNFKDSISLRYIEILESIEPTDAKLLKKFHEVMVSVKDSELTKKGLAKDPLVAFLNVSELEYYESVFSLFRLQFLQPTSFELPMSVGSNKATPFKGAEVTLITPLGRKLVELSIKCPPYNVSLHLCCQLYKAILLDRGQVIVIH